jgi:hypothetical protein
MAGSEAINEWGAPNGYTTVLWANPVPLDLLGNSTKMYFGNVAGGSVFCAVFKHHTGRTRRGWVLCSGSSFGRGSQRVKVRCDEHIAESYNWKEIESDSRHVASMERPDPQTHLLWDKDLDD